MFIRVNIGKGQAGKTTFTAKNVNQRQKEEVCVLATHPFRLIFNDLQMKLNQEGIRPINPTNISANKRKKLIKSLQQNTEWENGYPIFAGLNNTTFWDRMESYISICKTRHKTTGYIDEFETNQIGFNDMRVQVQKDEWCQDIIVQQKFNLLDLSSATTVGALISNLEYDEINVIPPMPGYNDKINYNEVTNKDIQFLKDGILRDNIRDGLQNCQRHSMINIDTSQGVHTIIADSLAKAIQQEQLKTIDGRRIIPVVVNEKHSLDYDLVNDYKDYSCVYIGGQMFARGVTFPHLQNLIINKSDSDISVLLQAVMRLFGRKDYDIRVWCTSRQQERIEEGRRLEDRVREESILDRPYKARKEWIESLRFNPNSIIINKRKNNGFRQHKSKTAHEPIEMYRSLPTDLTNYCILSKHVNGSPPDNRGSTRFGLPKSGRNHTDQEKAELFQIVIDKHPQVGSLINPQQSNFDILSRQYIVPPHEEEYRDGDNVWIEKELADHGEDWSEHRHIKTTYKRIEEHLKADNKPFVLSASSRDNLYNVYHNLSALPEDAKLSNSTKVIKN